MGFLFIQCFKSMSCFHINQEKCICSHRVLSIFTLASPVAATMWIITVQLLLVSVGITESQNL